MTEKISSDSSLKLVIYKKIVDGDFRKFIAESNDAQTGGGARDLRFSPATKFFPIFQRMFLGRDNGVLKGNVYWIGADITTKVSIHPPTKSRPSEVRIGRVHECIPEPLINSIPDRNDCILVLATDNSNRVYGFFTSLKSLTEDPWDYSFKKIIIDGIVTERSSKFSGMGYIDYENNEIYTK